MEIKEKNFSMLAAGYGLIGLKIFYPNSLGYDREFRDRGFFRIHGAMCHQRRCRADAFKLRAVLLRIIQSIILQAWQERTRTAEGLF